MTTGDRVFAAEPLRDILDRIADGVLSVDRAWTITFANEAGLRLVSRAGEDLTGRHLWEVFPEAVNGTFERRFQEALDTQEPAIFEEWFEPLGSWFSVRAFPFSEGLTVCFGDVTASRLTQQQLTERARQQAALAELSTRCMAEPNVETALLAIARTIASMQDADRVEIVAGRGPGGSSAVIAAHGAQGDDPRLGVPLRLTVPGDADGGELRIYRSVAASSEADSREFLAALVALIATCTRRYAMLREVEYLADHDPVTGLPNRRLLIGHLERVLATAEPDAPPSAVLTVAIDRPWMITNSFGHRAGDELVVALADRIRRVCEPHAMLAQLATDLFVLVMHQPTIELTAQRLADRLHAAMREPMRLNSGEHFITLSVGIVHADGDCTPGTLLRDADTALRLARPPLRTAVFDQDAHDQAVRRTMLDRDLHQAVERGELCLHYQPIVEAGTDRPVGVEALVRWDHPERGLIYPGGFIEAAEDNGLIVPIGHWVLRQACRQVAQLQRELDRPLSVSVNVSARQLTDPGFVELVSDAIAEAGLRRGSLELEITESALMEEAGTIGELLAEFSRHDVRLALDDFGSGYSSLSYLRQLPVDTLKVDRSFVTDLARSADTAIVEAIVKMAHAMGMQVVAEGVESAAQLEILTGLACDRLQGFLFQRPVALDELRAYLRS